MTTHPRTIVVLCVCSLGVQAFGQSVLAPPPPEFMPPPPPAFGPGQPSPEEQNAAEQTLGAGQQAIEWGITHFHPRLMYRLSYGDGLPGSNGEGQTLVNELIPGVTLNIGDRWAIDYTPTIRFYSSDNYRDSVDHRVSLHGFTPYKDWVFGFSHSSALTSDPLIQTGQQTDEQTHSTGLNGGYSINSELSLELGLSQNLRFTEDFNDSMSWSTMDWLNYQYAPRLGFGLGLGAGYVEVSEGSDMTFQQVLGRITFAAGEKLTFSGNGGVDIREFLDSDASPLANPIFGLAATYQVFEGTALSLSGSRSINSSYYSSQVTEDASISGGLSQRLLKNLHLSLNGGYRISTYKATSMGVSASREDKGPFFSARLSTTFLKRATAGLFYYYNENESNSGSYSYSSNQYGLEIGYRF
jgi:hypothetical protein